MEVANFTMRKTIIDQGSSVDILYMSTFRQLRPVLNALGAIVSTPYLVMKFPSSTQQIMIVRVD
ncbi:hypothetical protein CR513_54016, partial [Mucuna pruriens]